jgi:hypothetical protein
MVKAPRLAQIARSSGSPRTASLAVALLVFASRCPSHSFCRAPVPGIRPVNVLSANVKRGGTARTARPRLTRFEAHEQFPGYVGP